MFDSRWRDEIIPENPVARVGVPKNATTDERTRVLLSDLELLQTRTGGAAAPRVLKVREVGE